VGPTPALATATDPHPAGPPVVRPRAGSPHEVKELRAAAALWALVIVAVFIGLWWAAVQDGRDESRFRARR